MAWASGLRAVAFCWAELLWLTASFARDLMESYARQRYERLLQLHSSDFIKNLLSETGILGSSVLAPLVGDAEKGSARRSQVEMTLDVMASSLVYWTQGLMWRGLVGEGGRVLAMSSAGSKRVTAGYGMVSAAKAALESYVRQLALELAPKRIAVNTIRAGVTHTAAVEKIPGWEGLIERARTINPGGRTTTVEDVANAVSLLVRPEAAWLTGNVLGVDGGEDIVG